MSTVKPKPESVCPHCGFFQIPPQDAGRSLSFYTANNSYIKRHVVRCRRSQDWERAYFKITHLWPREKVVQRVQRDGVASVLEAAKKSINRNSFGILGRDYGWVELQPGQLVGPTKKKPHSSTGVR